MAEGNFPGTGPSNDIPSFDPLAKLQDLFIRLAPLHQREFMQWLARGSSEDIKSNQSERLEAVRSQGEGDPDANLAAERTMVGFQLANANAEIASLIDALKDKDGLIDKMSEKNNALSRDLKDRDEKLQNATLKMAELEKTKTKLSECEEKCDQLTIQVHNLLDEIKDRDVKIHSMAQRAQQRQEQFEVRLAEVRDENARLLRQQAQQGQEQFEAQLADLREQNARLLRQEAQQRRQHNVEEFAQLEEQLADVREENARLRQQVEEEIGRNQIFTRWFNNARRYLRQGEPPLPLEEPPLPQEEPPLAELFGFPDTGVTPNTLE